MGIEALCHEMREVPPLIQQTPHSNSQPGLQACTCTQVCTWVHRNAKGNEQRVNTGVSIVLGLNAFVQQQTMKVLEGKLLTRVRQAGEGGGFMGWVIRIIFDPNTRQWGGGGVYGVGDPWITFGSFLDHFAHCTFNSVPMVLWTFASFFGSQIVGTSEFTFLDHL